MTREMKDDGRLKKAFEAVVKALDDLNIELKKMEKGEADDRKEDLCLQLLPHEIRHSRRM